jgi:hypothetical protein
MEHNESGSAARPGSAYLLDNARREASARFSALATMLDAGTICHLEEHGWHCLEVGGGGGSVATLLAARVGRGGRVANGFGFAPMIWPILYSDIQDVSQ